MAGSRTHHLAPLQSLNRDDKVRDPPATHWSAPPVGTQAPPSFTLLPQIYFPLHSPASHYAQHDSAPLEPLLHHGPLWTPVEDVTSDLCESLLPFMALGGLHLTF
ncbi:MAG: hypothetical protein L6R36_007062 [Xanthoria steineri]|nr:MAG: hypothetical protein L6R36_007062 [Xanthoria steineri]